MEQSGALFTGDKEINGVIYHFKENGTVGSVPPVPTAQVWSANGNQTSGSDSSSSREKVRVRDVVQNDIIDAVHQTSGSEHIASCLLYTSTQAAKGCPLNAHNEEGEGWGKQS